MDAFVRFENNTALAFKIDLEKLILAYEKEQTLLFEPFAKIWRDMTFSLIYGGQILAAELKLFTELLFRITVKYVLCERSLFAQTGALYALYALYYKQPYKNWIKIRLTYDQAEILAKLIDSLKENSAQEALYIYAKMCTDNAFLYVAAELPRGLEVKFARQEHVGQLIPYSTDVDPLQNSLTTFIQNNLTELETVDGLYKEEFKKFKANPNVMLVGQDTGPSIGEKLKEILEGRQIPDVSEEVDCEKDPIHVKRAKLREKAQKADVQSHKTKQREIRKLLEEVKAKYQEASEDDDESD